MMPFASKRRKATDGATVGLRPLIASAQVSGGVSFDAYIDPYVASFLFTLAGLFAQAAAKGKASHADIGFAISDAFSNVTNHNGQRLSALAASYLASKNEYAVAANEGAMIYFYHTFEIMQHEDEHPLIQAAEERAEFFLSSGIASDYRGAVGAGILEETFLGRIKELREGASHA